FLFFFFQAEDGIRDRNVTGVQTCALPISAAYTQLDQALDKVDRDCATRGNRLYYLATPPDAFPTIVQHLGSAGLGRPRDPEKNRSEERRVGKECKNRWGREA